MKTDIDLDDAFRYAARVITCGCLGVVLILIGGCVALWL